MTKQNPNQCPYDEFVKSVKSFEGKISRKECETLKEVFPGQTLQVKGKHIIHINIAKILENETFVLLDDIYKNTHMK
jgi:hypothetical protein